MAQNSELIPAVVRAVWTLERFSAERPTVTPGALAEELDINSHTAGRLLHTLAWVGLLRQHVLGPHARYYLPTARVLTLGSGYLAIGWDVAQAALREIAQTTGVCAILAVLDGGVVCVAVAGPPTGGLVRVALHPGKPLSVTTAPGLVLLAGLPADALDAWLRRHAADVDAAAVGRLAARVRLEGSAYRQVQGEETWSLAAPVAGGDGQVVAAVGLVGHQRAPDQAVQQQWHKLLGEASHELGGLLPASTALLAPAVAWPRP